MINMATRTREKDGCQYIASSRLYVFPAGDVNADANGLQLLSVISLLSSEKPNLDSPANVDAAKEVRTEFECKHLCRALVHDIINYDIVFL